MSERVSSGNVPWAQKQHEGSRIEKQEMLHEKEQKMYLGHDVYRKVQRRDNVRG